MSSTTSERRLPVPTPETEHFWEAARHGDLLLQQCHECDHVYFPPRPFCPSCASRDVDIVEASGRATLYSYVINQRSMPGYDAPYSIAVVELEEGPRMMTNIVGCEQTAEALQLDMELEVVFEECSDTISLPLFRPVGGVA